MFNDSFIFLKILSSSRILLQCLGINFIEYRVYNQANTRTWKKELVTQSCPTLFDPWTVACQALLSMGFSRQEYWSGLPFPSAGDLPDPGIKPTSLMSPPLAGRFFTTNITREAPIIPGGILNLRERMYHLQGHILFSFGSLRMEDK